MARAIQVFLPFDRQHGLFQIVAILAGGDEIFLGRPSTSRQRNQMVHGQIMKIDLLAAVVAQTGSGLLLPPSAFAHLPGFCPLAADFRIVRGIKIEILPCH